MRRPLGNRARHPAWHWDGHGNLPDAARDARLRLIDGWRGDNLAQCALCP